MIKVMTPRMTSWGRELAYAQPAQQRVFPLHNDIDSHADQHWRHDIEDFAQHGIEAGQRHPALINRRIVEQTDKWMAFLGLRSGHEQ